MTGKLHERIASFSGRWLNHLERGAVWGAVVLVCVIAVILYLRYPGNFQAYQVHPPGDFAVYLKAWERVQLGVSPYVAEDFSPYKYSPGVLALIQFLPNSPGDAWFAFSTFCIAAFSLALIAGARYRSWKDVFSLALGLCLAWKGILETFDYGQIEIFIFSVAIFSASLFARYTFFSGFFLGLLPWIKLPWLLLLFPFVLAATRIDPTGVPKPPVRRLRLLVSGYVLSSFFWGAALPSLTFGPDKALQLSQEWIQVLKQQPHELFFNNINQSLWISSARFLGENTWLALSVPLLIAATLMGFLIRRRPMSVSSQDTMSWLSPWLILVQIMNPLSWRWGSVYLVGAVFSTRRSHFARKPLLGHVAVRPLLWLGVLVTFLLQLNPVVRQMGIQHWTELHGYGVVTIYWILVLLLSL